MHRKTRYLLLLSGVAFLVANGCTRTKQTAGKTPENTFSVRGSVREMNLYPEGAPAFPEHDGKAEFISYCGICHTLKYISMQPNFPPKTWDAEVNKMIVKYHAPIDSVAGKKIIAYLVAVKSSS
jgi:hypothetical protein